MDHSRVGLMAHAAGHRAGHPPSRCEQCGSALGDDPVVTSMGKRLCGECTTNLEAEELALLQQSSDPVSAAVTIRGALRWIRHSKRSRDRPAVYSTVLTARRITPTTRAHRIRSRT